jgi:DNA topoisomerase-1
MLGADPGTGEEVWLKIGRFGPYVQRGTGAEAKRSSLPPATAPAEIDLELALKLLALPREVGADPETGKPVTAGINRYGPFVQLEGRYVRLEPDDDVFSIGMNRALALLAESPKGRRTAAAAGPLRELGPHPADEQPITLHAGRFGPYVKHGKLNASLPKRLTPETLTVEQAVQLLAERAEKVAQGGGRAKPGARAKTAKASAKATTARKPVAKAPRTGAGKPAVKSASAKTPARKRS